MEGCDDICSYVIANQVRFRSVFVGRGSILIFRLSFSSFFTTQLLKNVFKEIQKLAYGALQNQVQERITSDDKRIENELIARRDIMKIKFNLKIENMMFSIAMQSAELPPIIKIGNEKSEKILELWNLQQQSPGKLLINYD